MRRMLPVAQSMLGFDMLGVPNGFCGGIAMLGALAYRPSVQHKGYTLTPTGAANLFAHMHSHGWCGVNGAMNIYQLFDGLKDIASGTHTLIDYSAFHLNTLHQTLQDRAGIQAIIVEYADGGAFPSNEGSLRYHFNCVLGVDSEIPTEGYIGGYAFCDDDSSQNHRPAVANAPIWHCYPIIAKATPIAYIVCFQ